MATDVPDHTRKQVYERDGYRCRWCGRTNGSFAIHHIVYRSAGVDHSPGNLILLCEPHHRLVHTDKGTYPPLLARLLELGPAVTGIQLHRRQSRRALNTAANPDAH